MNTVLVTGASGFIGRALVRHLLATGHQVRVLTRRPSDTVFPAEVVRIQGDLLEPDALPPGLLDDVDVLFHCAGEIADTSRMRRLHVDGTRALLNLAGQRSALNPAAAPLRWIQLSSVGAYGQAERGGTDRVVTEATPEHPRGDYEITKTEADHLLLVAATAGQVRLTIVRPSNVFGVGMPNRSLPGLVNAIRRGRFFYIGDRQAISTYVHVDDVARALVACAKHPVAIGKTYNLSNDCPLRELVDAVADACGRRRPWLVVPEAAVRAVTRLLAARPFWPLTQSRIDALVARTRYPSDLIRAELGFECARPVPVSVLELLDPEESVRREICFVSTIAWPLRVYIGPQIRSVAQHCRVTLVADGIAELGDAFGDTARLKDISIRRQISPGADLRALVSLWRWFRANRFAGVHSIMPKAGLLAMLAARLAGVPVRLHTFTGQVWVTRTGLARRFLMGMDRQIARLATCVLADSFSQREFLIDNGIVPDDKIVVLAKGSVCGVDTERFCPDSASRERIRRDCDIAAEDFVLLFVGRLNRDKGVGELLQAFLELASSHVQLHLMLVGPDEGGYDAELAQLPPGIRGRIHRIGFTQHPEHCMASADAICLPSYREGFGSVLIEAGACGVPAIASRIYGISDAVADGVTGILVPPGNAGELADAITTLMEDPPLRQSMGAAARQRVVDEFAQERLTTAFLEFYRRHHLL